MVSSKCCQVESPSPLRFLAALMPPCAQTEWERFTGTIENRSTWPPISAILMTAARPARPPPTTMIFGAAAAMSVHRPCGKNFRMTGIHNVAAGSGLLEALAECIKADESDDAHEEEECEANFEEPFLRLLAGDDAPLRAEEPDSVRKVPRGGDESDDVEGEQEGRVNFPLDFREGLRRHIVKVDAGETHRVGVPDDVDERDAAGPSLEGVHPVAGPGILANVRIAAIPDVEAVQAVIQDRNPDTEQFQEEHKRQVREEADLARVAVGPADRGGVGNQNVLEQKCADGNNPG